MVPAKSWSAPRLLEDGFPAFTHNSVNSLNQILHITNATIVLTTSHRNRFSEIEWSSIFSKRGIEANIQKCPSEIDNRVPRIELILNWLDLNSTLSNFIIIDDDKSLNDLPLNLKQNLILTSPLIGLNDSLVENALEKLTQNYWSRQNQNLEHLLVI